MIVVSESHKENIPKSTQIGWSEFFSAPDEVLLLTAYRDKAFFYPPSTVPILINSRNAKRPLTQNLQYHMTQEGGEAINRIFGMLPYNPKTPLIRWFSKNGKTKEGIECVNEISDYYPGMVTLDKYIANEQVRNSMNCSSGKLALRSMFDQVFNAVGAIHNLGYLHRDIKPSNIGVLPYRVVSIDSNRIDIQNFDYDPFNVCIKLFDYETVVPKFSKRFLALRGRTDRYASPEAIPENVKKIMGLYRNDDDFKSYVMQGVDLFSLSVSLGEVLATLVAPELPILGTKLGRVDRELNLSLVDSTNYKLEASVSEVICGYYGNDCLEILNSVLGTSPEDINRRSKDVAFKNFRNSLMTYLFASL